MLQKYNIYFVLQKIISYFAIYCKIRIRNMEISKITELLTKKFSGVRPDGLAQLALSLAVTATDENIESTIESLSADNVNAFVNAWRKSADAEISKATKSHETNLRNKYNFIDKNAGTNDPNPNNNGNGNDIQKIIADAVAASQKQLLDEIASLKNHNQTESRLKVVNGLFDDKTPGEFKNSIIGEFTSRTFNSDDDFNKFIEDKKTSIANFNQELINSGLINTPNPVYGKADSDGVSDSVKAWAKARTDKESAGKKLF